jgi:hypothetical protein
VDNLVTVIYPIGELIRPAHPVYPDVNVVLVAGADLEDPSDPVVVRVLYGFLSFTGPLPLDTRIVSDIYKVSTNVLNTFNCCPVSLG